MTLLRSSSSLVLLLAFGAYGGTVHVDGSNPNCPGSGTAADPYCAIQAAINAAQPGDVVRVHPGTYVELLDFLGKAITIESTDGPAVTTVDGNQVGRVVTFQSAEGNDSVLRGFTITNGHGGLRTVLASPTIEGNVITGNAATISMNPSDGGGLSMLLGSPIVRDNLFTGNQATSGGALAENGGSLVIDAAGPVGSVPFMFIGVGEGLVCVPPVGALLVDLNQPYVQLGWPSPSVTVIPLPAVLLPPNVTMQLATLGPPPGTGQASNLEVVELPWRTGSVPGTFPVIVRLSAPEFDPRQPAR